MKSQWIRKHGANGYVKYLKNKNRYKNITIKKTKLQRVKGKPWGYTVYYYSK